MWLHSSVTPKKYLKRNNYANSTQSRDLSRASASDRHRRARSHGSKGRAAHLVGCRRDRAGVAHYRDVYFMMKQGNMEARRLRRRNRWKPFYYIKTFPRLKTWIDDDGNIICGYEES